MADDRGRLVSCKECGNFVMDEDDLVKHLKKIHHLSIGEYKQKYPAARTDKLPAEGAVKHEELVQLISKIEESVDPKNPYNEEDKERFSPSDITDIDYLRQILETAHPEKWEYYKAVIQELLDSGIPDCKALYDYAVIQVYIRDFHLAKMANPDAKGRFLLDKREVETLEKMGVTAGKTMELLRDIFERTREEKTIADEMEGVMNQAEIHIKQNIGEFAFKCRNCSAMVDTMGLPHWAYEASQDAQGRNIYMIWNKELWELVCGIKIVDKFGNAAVYKISPWQMAYTLETSIEGLMYTAKARGMAVDRFEADGRKMGDIEGVKFDIGAEEEQLKIAYDQFKLKWHTKMLRDV